MNREIFRCRWFTVSYVDGHTMNRREKLLWRIVYLRNMLLRILTGRRNFR